MLSGNQVGVRRRSGQRCLFVSLITDFLSLSPATECNISSKKNLTNEATISINIFDILLLRQYVQINVRYLLTENSSCF